MPREWLAGSPFADYVIPSLVLVLVVGGSLLIAAVAVLARLRTARLTAYAAAAILLIWIVVQVAIIGYVSWMQPATIAVAVLILVLARRLPPASPDSSTAR